MTTYPGPSDPVQAITRADGSTSTHSDDHGNIIDIAVNAKKYLRGDGTTESSTQVGLLATAGSGRHIHFPKGTYVFPDATGITTLATATVVSGAGRQNTTISAKNAYAFTFTSVNDIDVSGINFILRSGATGGGAVKCDSVSSSKLHDIYCDMVSTSSDPAVYMKGGVNNHLDRVQAGGMAAPGIKLDATGSTLAFNNANSLYRCRVNSTQGSTTAAVYSTGGGGNRFRDLILESNRGYGLQLVSETSDVAESIWFEDNSNHNLIISDGGPHQIIGNKVQYNHGDVGAAEHFHITGSAGGRHCHRIEGNIFQDSSSSGVAINIGAGVEFTLVIGNRGAGFGNGTTITNSGSYTVGWGNDSGSTRYDDVRVPLTNSSSLGGRISAGSGGSYTIKGDTQTGDNGDIVASGLFAVSDSLGEDEFGVSRKGYAVFHTKNGDPSTGMLPTNGFTFYWDEANQRLAVRYRNNSGSSATFPVAAATSSAYTVTNPTTDRALNVTADTLAQVAEVLGTLIADLQTQGILA